MRHKKASVVQAFALRCLRVIASEWGWSWRVELDGGAGGRGRDMLMKLQSWEEKRARPVLTGQEVSPNWVQWRTRPSPLCVCCSPILAPAPLLSPFSHPLSWSEQHQQSRQEHHPDHHACWHQADRREQTGQLRHSAAVPAAPAAGTGHSSEAHTLASSCARGPNSDRRVTQVPGICLQVRIQTVPAQQLQQHMATGSPKSVSTVVVTTAPSPKCAPDPSPATQQWPSPACALCLLAFTVTLSAEACLPLKMFLV